MLIVFSILRHDFNPSWPGIYCPVYTVQNVVERFWLADCHVTLWNEEEWACEGLVWPVDNAYTYHRVHSVSIVSANTMRKECLSKSFRPIMPGWYF